MRDGHDPGRSSSDALKSTSSWGALPAWPLVAFATALAFGLAFHQLGHASFWGDEVETWRVAHQPFDRVWWATSMAHHPPLYFWFMHLWVSIGAAPPDEFWLRLPSAFFFALTVPMTYSIARTLSGATRAGVYAAFLAATFPFLLHYGREARSYAMVAFFAACGFAAVAHLMCRWREGKEAPRLIGAGLAEAGRWRARGHFRPSDLCGGRSCDPHTPGWRALGDDGLWGAYIVSSVAVMWLHNTAGLYPVVAGLILLFAIWAAPSFRGVRFAGLCIATALIALGYSPQLPALLGSLSLVDVSHRIPTPDANLVFSLLAQVYGPTHLPGWGRLFLAALAGLAVFALVSWARSAEWHRVAFAGLGWLGALILLTAFSFWKPIVQPKMLIWSLPPFLATCAAGIALLPRLPVQAAVLAVLLASNLPGIAHEWRTGLQDWRGATKLLARDASSGTAVLYCPFWLSEFVHHYWRRLERRPVLDSYGLRRTREMRRKPVPGPPEFVRIDGTTEPVDFGPAALFPGYRRVHVVWNRTAECGEWMGTVDAALSEGGRLVKEQRVPGLSLFLYERKE